ncbi:hypothetical protein D3C87_1770510 [compost metagenome]
MHHLQFVARQRPADAEQINRLAARHALAAGGARQRLGGLDDQRGRDRHGGQQIERQRLQRIAGQHGGGFVELHVRGGPATAQRVVIHAGQVVMDQRIGMDQFHGGGGAVERGFDG